MSNVRIGYPRETPSAWKGALALPESLFPSALTLQNANFLQVLSASDLEFRERRLIINVQPSIAPTIPTAQPVYSGPRVGSYLTGISTQVVYGSLGRKLNVGIRITCNGYTQSVLQCDARQGVYRIPPCTSVTLSAVLSRVNSEVGVYTPVTIRAELCDSCEGPVIRPTETVAIAFLTGTQCSVNLNPYCRWIDFNASSDDFGTASAPVLTAYPYNVALPLVGALGPTLQRDYVNKTWFPSGDPIDVGGGINVFSDYGQSEYRLRNGGTGTAYTQFTQFLEW